MKKHFLNYLTVILLAHVIFSSSVLSQNDSTTYSELKKKHGLKSEPQNNWAINLTFSDNGFGLGAAKYFHLTKDISLVTGVIFSGAKDDREFDQTDIFGNSVTPFKVNRLFMFPILNVGLQFRMFRDDVTSDMRPFFNFGVSPAAIIYTPYKEPFFSSFKYAQAKYTLGGYAGVGLDYITSRKSGLSFNLRYYYMRLFGEGIQSISTAEMKNFGGIYFLFSYNFVR